MKLYKELVPAVKNLQEISQHLVNTKLVGDYKSVFKGKGLEFSGYRDYTSHDDASLIDWKASMRTNTILSREYSEERNLNILFLLDVSSTMFFGSAKKVKRQYSIEIAAALGFAMLRAGDGIGVSTFSDKLLDTLKPNSGMKQFQFFLKAITKNSSGGGYDLSNAIKQILSYLKDASLLVIISDFIGNKGWEPFLRLAARKTEVMGIMVRDPRDKTLPYVDGLVAVKDPFSNQATIVSPKKLVGEYERAVKDEEREIKNLFLTSGADFLNLSTDKSFIHPLILFLKKRAARWR